MCKYVNGKNLKIKYIVLKSVKFKCIVLFSTRVINVNEKI